MTLKTTLLTAAAIMLAATVFAAPAQAFAILPGGIGPEPAVRNPCDNMISPDPDVQAIINECRHLDDGVNPGEILILVNQVVDTVLGLVPVIDPNNLLPDVCSTQENVVPYALECVAWAIDQVDIPGIGVIVALINALSAWALDYALVQLPAWADGAIDQANLDLAAEGNWVLAQTGYSAAVQTWANGVAGQAVGNAGGEVTYATTTAGTAAADAIALAFYADCRLLSVGTCGNVPAPHVPGTPPTLVTPGNPPLPSTPPAPTVPSPPPTPSMPPV
jgi:hypothetical protein